VFKKDPIFWWASGIFVLALALFAITQNQFWLALMIGSYLLRPTLASLGFANRYVDERQLNIHYRSGNIGFVVMIIICVIFAIKLSAEDNHDFELFAMTIIIGLVARALFNVLLVKDLREAASKIIIGAGLLIALFGSFHTFDNWSLLKFIKYITPGLAIAGVGFLSKFYPRPAGIVIFIAAAFLLWVILGKGFTWAQIGTAAIVGVPLMLAGVFLYRGDKKNSNVKT